MSRLSHIVLLGVAGCAVKGDPPLVSVTDANNYAFQVGVSFSSVPMAAYRDGVVDWSALTVDMRGSPVASPSDVQLVRLISTSLDEAGLETAIADGTFEQADIRTPWEYENAAGGSSCALSAFSVSGNRFDPAGTDPGLGFFLPDGQTFSWFVSLWSVNEALGAWQILSAAFLVPAEGEGNTVAAMGNESAELEFSVDLHSATPVTVTPGAAGLDWSGVAQDAQGRPFDVTRAAQLFIAHVAAPATVPELEPVLLTTLGDADTWLLNVYGEDMVPDLGAALSPRDGSAFPGFDADGIWVVGILDPTGGEPAPFLMFTVNVTGA